MRWEILFLLIGQMLRGLDTERKYGAENTEEICSSVHTHQPQKERRPGVQHDLAREQVTPEMQPWSHGSPHFSSTSDHSH